VGRRYIESNAGAADTIFGKVGVDFHR